MKQILNHHNRKILYLLSFIEGASVMAVELLGAKMLAPFFGSSLYVWSTVMAITLGGLALGYFTGGYFSESKKNTNFLFYIVLVAACFSAIMPFNSQLILSLMGSENLVLSIIIATFLFLFPPVFLMGMVSPLIIEKLSSPNHHAGKIAGSIYAISTLGGIIATFAMGFYIIPTFGLSKPAYFIALLLSVIPMILLYKNKNTSIFIAFFFLLIGYKLFAVKPAESDIKVLYNKEGMLGQVLVTDYPVYNNSQTPAYYMRYLFFNRVAQAWYNPNDSLTRYFPYVNMMLDEIKFNQLKGKALLLGLGGGGVANELIKQSFEVDAVELDPRVSEVATKYFNLDRRVKVTINDGRRYIKNCTKKYDLIVFDVFKGEENPAHMLTSESLNEVKKILTPDGCIILNGYGFLKGEKGKGMRAIIKTIAASGYKIKIVETNTNENYSNTLLFCANTNFETRKQSQTIEQISSNDVPILYDEFPKLEILNKSAVAAWRKAYIESTIKDFNQRSIPLFQ